ncbi:MAG: amidohydrolase family protein [Planctomycetes bacterium]|nr:amidohydrolase family protein [Planctomycetota bacterium]
MIIDVHCHYTLTRRTASPAIERFSFEPAFGPARPALDSFVSPRALRRMSFRLYRWVSGLPAEPESGPAVDESLAALYEQHLLADGPIDRYVLLAFDEYHTRDGRRPEPPERPEHFGSDIYTSNSFIRSLCRARPDRFLFGASVHPYRENAAECIREVAAGGACLLKWLPLHQNIDIADPRTVAVLRCCAEIGLPILVHYNEEFTLRTQHPEHLPLWPLLDVLRGLRRDGTMPTTIVAHVATPVTPMGFERPHFELLDALQNEFADAPLYADISALTTIGKIRYLRSMARRQELHGKLLFGSDFPVPHALWRLRRDLGRSYRRIAACPSWPQQAAMACRDIGFNDIVFRRAASLLRGVAH